MNKNSGNAVSNAWEFDIELGDNRVSKFFLFVTLNKGPENNDTILDELANRIIDTIKYQQNILKGNNISVTNEDFFEQCLQKSNSEISNFLRDISIALPVHSWAIVIGMLSPDEKQKRMEFLTSRFGEVTGWLLNCAQLETKKLINIFDEPDPLPYSQIPQKFFRSILNSYLPQNDQLFFCTPNLLNYISLSDIKKALSTLSVPASLKHFENQVDPNINNALVASMSIKLSAYPTVEQATTTDINTGVERSMGTMIARQEETEKLLGNSAGFKITSITLFSKNLANTLKSKLFPNNLEIVPSQGGKHRKNNLTKVAAYSASSVSNLKKFLQKRVTEQTSKAIRKNKKLQLLSTNKTITKVSVWKKKLSLLLSPIIKYFKHQNWGKLIKNPISYFALAAIIVVFLLVSTWRTSINDKKVAFAAAENSLVQVSVNLTRIDSHLIVGRENDAVVLLQDSQDLLDSVASFADLNDQSTKLADELESRLRKVRKEILIKSPIIVISNLSNLLGSVPKSLALSENNLVIFPESPSKLVAINTDDNSSNIIDTKTDLTSWTSFNLVNKSELLVTSKNTITVVNTSNGESTSNTANIQSDLLGTQFFNTRLYTLAPQENQVYKSNRAPSYSILTKWITDENLNISEARDLAIDGSIYILLPGDIIQLTKGRPARPGIGLDTIDPALTNAQKIKVSDSSSRIYITEPNRLIVFEKTGKFIAQYVVNNDKEILDVAVDNNKNKAYILTKDEVLEVGL